MPKLVKFASKMPVRLALAWLTNGSRSLISGELKLGAAP